MGKVDGEPTLHGHGEGSHHEEDEEEELVSIMGMISMRAFFLCLRTIFTAVVPLPRRYRQLQAGRVVLYHMTFSLTRERK